MNWLTEGPEPILAETMDREARIARRAAIEAGEDVQHPLDCRCHRCLVEDFDPEYDS